MSNVYARNRKETKLQFMVNALELQRDIVQTILREKVVPKKFRLILGTDIVHKANELVDNLTFANNVFTIDEETLLTRTLYQEQAKSNCYQLQNLLICLTNCVDTFKNENCTKFIDRIAHEIELINGWIASNKIQKDKKKKQPD